mgnify:CR=1 FL=1
MKSHSCDSEPAIADSLVDFVAATQGASVPSQARVGLQNIRDIHLNSTVMTEMEPQGSRDTVVLFIAIAFFIVLIACINFMNLSTARSTERAKEVGLRKVMGSIKEQLIAQFLTESVLLSFASLSVAVALAYLSFPYFTNITGIHFNFGLISNPITLGAIVISVFIIGILAGLYPAFVISGFKPAVVLKGKMQTSTKGVYLRNGLVIFQFAISILLISCTLIVYEQMNYLLNKDMGFDKENMLIIENANLVADKMEVFREQLLKNPNIMKVGYSSALPGQTYPGFVAQLPDAEKENYLSFLAAPPAYMKGKPEPVYDWQEISQ